MITKKMSQRVYRVIATLVGLGLLVVLGFSLNALFSSRSQQPAQPVSQPETQGQLSEEAAIEKPSPTPDETESMETPTTPSPDSSSLDDYVFGKPEVVLTHKTAIGIAGWLPDSERLLITRDIPAATSRQTIETFNVRTGESVVYAERHTLAAKPVWLQSRQAVAYGDFRPSELVISFGPGKKTRIASDLYSEYIAADTSGERLAFFTEPLQKHLSLFYTDQEKRQATSLALPSQGLYKIAWRPGTDHLALYSNAGLFLTDLATGQVERVDLGSSRSGGELWPLVARWSPNGRYLAIVTTAGDFPLKFSDLTIMDIETETRHHLDLATSYLYDVTWLSNNQSLVALGQIGLQNGRPLMGLFLVDVNSGKSRRMLSKHVFGGGATEGWLLAASPKEDTIAIKCPVWLEEEPTIAQDRLCLISISMQP